MRRRNAAIDSFTLSDSGEPSLLSAVRFGHLATINIPFKVRLAKEAGTYVLSERVSGAIDRNNKQRRYGTLDEVAHSDGTVRLVFGPNPVIEEFEERAIADLSGISTPPTPDPFH